MRVTFSAIIATLAVLIGFFFGQPYLWIPSSVLIAGFIDLYTRRWVMSDRLGSARNLSASTKFLFALVGFYAMLGQIVCIGLIVWWFVF